MNEPETAFEYEQAGEFAAAADRYFDRAVDTLVEHDYDPTMDGGAAVGYLLQALSAATRADDPFRSTTFRAAVVDLCEQCLQSPEDRTTAELACCAEWIGDAHLLTGRAEAVEYFERASTQFGSADEMDRMSWQMEKGNDYRDFALGAYLESEIDLDDGDDLWAHSFADRLERKIDIVESVR